MHTAITDSTDARYTPHGHTAADARSEPRCVCRVKIRADQMSQTLPDGRSYGPGEHTIQIYESDLVNLVALHEDRPDLLEMARVNCAARTAEFVVSNRKVHADVGDAEAEVLSRREAPFNVPAEFRILIRTRDLLPVESYEVLGRLDPVGVSAERAQLERMRASQTSPSELAGAIATALRDAGVIAAPSKTSK